MEQTWTQALEGMVSDQPAPVRWAVRPIARVLAKKVREGLAEAAQQPVPWETISRLSESADQIADGLRAAASGAAAIAGQARAEAEAAGIADGMTLAEAWEWMRWQPLPEGVAAIAAIAEGVNDDNPGANRSE